MGGGAAMRAAAKAAGAGILNNGLRGIVPDHPVSSAARKAAFPVGVLNQSSSSKNAVKSSNSAGVHQECDPVQTPCWELDDWELTGGEDDLFGVAHEGMPRLVFGGAPSIEEAKEATSELKDVLDKAYLSSPVSPNSSSARSWHSQSEALETKSLLSGEKVVAAAPPKHAMQAFKFLNESPAVQNVVASIACDPNVWNAVLLNPALQEYIQSQKMGGQGDECDMESIANDIISPKTPRSQDQPFGGDSTPSIMDYLQDLKLSVVDMISNLGDYFQNLFGGYNGEKDNRGNSMPSFVDKALGPSLLGLAVMVIMVVVLKRA